MVRLCILPLGEMLISNGSSIQFVLAGKEKKVDAVQHILGSGMAAILYQRKTLFNTA